MMSRGVILEGMKSIFKAKDVPPSRQRFAASAVLLQLHQIIIK